MDCDIFEKCVFNKIKEGFKNKKHTAISFSNGTFDEEVTRNLLNFGSLLEKDIKANVTQTEKGYSVRLSKPHLAFNMKDILSRGNPGIDLRFSEDLLEYEPEEELMLKSNIPLWVIKPMDGGNIVSIQRVW